MLGEYTREELMVEYLKDAIEMDPGEAFPAQMLENGVQFRGTGDDVIDAWEAALASGTTPDFVKDMKIADEDKALVAAWMKPKKSDGGGMPPAVQVSAQEVLDANPSFKPRVEALAEKLDAEGEELPDWLKEYVDGDVSDTFNKE